MSEQNLRQEFEKSEHCEDLDFAWNDEFDCYADSTTQWIYQFWQDGWQACAERKDERIAKLTEKLFALGAMDEAPCFHCGYSGERYFNPDKHPCAARHYGETE